MDQFLNQYEILFNKAKTDLKGAQILLDQFIKNEADLDLEIIYFHLQQCAEKLLKALLSKNEIYFPKTHDIELLFTLLDDNNIEITTNREILMKLSYYAVGGRYAVIHEDLDKTDIYINELINLSNVVNLRLQE